MQDKSKDFDLQIRSLLEDAEIKPSRRVWKGIRARLDSQGAVRPDASWMKWAGASLAFAAALALGVFFSGPGTQGPSIQPYGSVPVLADDSARPRVVETMDTDAAVKIIRGGDLRSLTAMAEPVSVRETGTPEADLASGDTAAETAPSVAKPKRETAESVGKSGNNDSGTDPFALMAMEDARKQRTMRTALYAKGMIGGNDSGIGLVRNSPMMAPGHNDSGITELSQSTYGIPVTFGLGVRLYVLPRLSLGTGIDYSLLTRTFSGEYKKTTDTETVSEAGSISHTLQYVGVPLNVYYDILDSDKIKFYVYGGGEAEFCVSNRYTLYSTPRISCVEPVRKLQYSVGVGLGVEFRLSDLLGLYIDPGLRYYFPGDQPKSVRTDKPLMASFDAGLRFNF